MKDDGYFKQRDPNKSLDLGELDELLDDLSCRITTLNFNKDGTLQSLSATHKGGLGSHLVFKMKNLYNLDLEMIDPVDEEYLHFVFHYSGKYHNKAEYRKQLIKEKDECGEWIYSGKDFGKWKIKKGMHKKYKSLLRELSSL